MGRILPFARNAQQVRELAGRQLVKGDLLSALELLRVSLEKAPQDNETVLAMARLYAQMQCWALSNSAYFSIAHEEACRAECFYGMGCNYYEMRSYTTARDCLIMALQTDPDADFVPDIVELLDITEEAKRDDDDLGAERMQHRMTRVMRAMDAGQARLGARQLRRMLPLDSRNGMLLSLQTFALLAAGDAKEALDAARSAYRKDRHDVRILCAMASALHANNSPAAAHSFLRRAQSEAPDDGSRQLVCHTACEIDAHAFVVDMLMEAEQEQPYADHMLHMLATALHNTGACEEAVRRWQLLKRIHPMDTVAAFRLRGATLKELPPLLPYTRQVPLSEMLHRLETLRGWTHEGQAALQARWQNDNALESLVSWGLACEEPGIANAMCSLLSSLGGAKAESLLRGLLCSPEASASLKETALASLSSMQAPLPLYAIMNDRLTLVNVSRVADESRHEPDRLQSLCRRVERRLAGFGDINGPLLRSICTLALANQKQQPVSILTHAAVLAYSAIARIPFSSSVPVAGRRKAARLAQHIIREVQHALH